jgi:hypothetical protein
MPTARRYRLAGSAYRGGGGNVDYRLTCPRDLGLVAPQLRGTLCRRDRAVWNDCAVLCPQSERFGTLDDDPEPFEDFGTVKDLGRGPVGALSRKTGRPRRENTLNLTAHARPPDDPTKLNRLFEPNDDATSALVNSCRLNWPELCAHEERHLWCGSDPVENVIAKAVALDLDETVNCAEADGTL